MMPTNRFFRYRNVALCMILAVPVIGVAGSPTVSTQDTGDYAVKVISRIEAKVTRIISKEVTDWDYRVWGFIPWRTTWKWAETNQLDLGCTATGSAWLTIVQGEPVLVTAAHVMYINVPRPELKPTNFTPETDVLLQENVNVLIGKTAVRPLQIAVLDVKRSLDSRCKLDIALIRPNDKSVVREARPLHLAQRLPKPFETVNVIGFQNDVDFPQIEPAVVTSVNPENGFFVLNREMSSGTSGGAVVDLSNNCYGVVSAAVKGQTVVLLVTSEMLKKPPWLQADEFLKTK